MLFRVIPTQLALLTNTIYSILYGKKGKGKKKERKKIGEIFNGR